MFVAHLPAGYLLAQPVRDRSRAVLPMILAASVLPDLDLLWFYGVSDRSVVHHAYPTHMPLFWVAACAVAWALLRALRVPRAGLLAGAALAALILHLALDSVAGGIRWLWPLSEAELLLIRVLAVHGWWVTNFVLHWSFLLELALLAAAAAVWHRRRAGAPPPA